MNEQMIYIYTNILKYGNTIYGCVESTYGYRILLVDKILYRQHTYYLDRV